MYSFTYKGATYQLTEKWLTKEEDYSQGKYDIRELQLQQFNAFIEEHDWPGLENRMFLPLQDGLIIKI